MYNLVERVEKMKPVLIGIAGGTASGKTAIAEKIYDASLSYGTVAIIKIDDYYKSLDHLSFDERKKINYDHPNAYDIELLISHLNDLLNNKAVKQPIYDFAKHTRSKQIKKINPASVIIVEGIMTFAIPELRKMFEVKIFVDTPDDVRFIRRLTRDLDFRGRTVESVIDQYLTTVRPMHLTFVEPSKKYADIIIPEGGKNKVAIDFLVAKIVNILKEEIN